jgi:hypothetical protein
MHALGQPKRKPSWHWQFSNVENHGHIRRQALNQAAATLEPTFRTKLIISFAFKRGMMKVS